MPELGLFPLPLSIVPTERVPLHIFEPRYKELIGECIEERGEFGLVLAEDDGMREVGTRCTVVEVLQEFDDGRLNVVVEGGERFRVIELTDGSSFQTAEVEPFDDEPHEPPSSEEIDLACTTFRRLADVAESDVDDPSPDSDQLSFELAARVDFGPTLKQDLLELRSERARLRRLVELLEHAIEALALEREVRDRAATNGKVSPR
jgi:Lon protease-like protein